MKKFRLDNKLVFILGGSGQIGTSISNLIAKAGGKVLILDKNRKSSLKLLNELKKNNFDSYYSYFDCSNLNNIEKNLKKIISINSY